MAIWAGHAAWKRRKTSSSLVSRGTEWTSNNRGIVRVAYMATSPESANQGGSVGNAMHARIDGKTLRRSQARTDPQG